MIGISFVLNVSTMKGEHRLITLTIQTIKYSALNLSVPATGRLRTATIVEEHLPCCCENPAFRNYFVRGVGHPPRIWIADWLGIPAFAVIVSIHITRRVCMVRLVENIQIFQKIQLQSPNDDPKWTQTSLFPSRQLDHALLATLDFLLRFDLILFCFPVFKDTHLQGSSFWSCKRKLNMVARVVSDVLCSCSPRDTRGSPATRIESLLIFAFRLLYKSIRSCTHCSRA